MIALYICLYGTKQLGLSLKDIAVLINKPRLAMRVQNFEALRTSGKKGLKASLRSPSLKAIFVKYKNQNESTLRKKVLDTVKL